VIGAFGAFHQNNLSRWLAYGSTNQMGFVIGCLISYDLAGIAASILYMIIYKLFSMMIFA
jgi:NADH:ubiquinone oxidoreductase subunit 2 (subunit N)